MQDILSHDSERRHIEAKLRRLFANPRHEQSIRDVRWPRLFGQPGGLAKVYSG